MTPDRPDRFDEPLFDFRPFVRDRVHGFAGRGWCLDAIADWLVDPAAGPLYVSGEPGCGKSALMSMLVSISAGDSQPPRPQFYPGFLAAVHFCSASDLRWNDPIEFTRSVSLQIAAANPEFARALIEEASQYRTEVTVQQTVGANSQEVIGLVINRLIVGDVDPRRAFTSLVLAPLHQTVRGKPGESVILLVDGLDESMSRGHSAIAQLMTGQAQPGLRFIASSRPHPGLERQLTRLGATTISLSSGDAARLDSDIRTYIQQRITNGLRARISPGLTLERFVGQCTHRCNGNFLYAKYLLAMLEAGTDPVDADAIMRAPADLDGVYLDYLDRIGRGTGAMWESGDSAVLGMLAVARQGAKESHLAAWGGYRPEQVRQILSRYDQLLEVTDRGNYSERLYALYHRSFADFLTDGSRAGEFWCSSQTNHETLSDYYLRTFPEAWDSCDDYGLAHLPNHLFSAGRDDVLVTLLGRGFLSAKSRRFAALRPALDDLRLGLRAAVRANQLAAAMRLICSHALFKRRVRDLPRAVLPLYAASGQVDRALELVALIDRPLEHRMTMLDIVRGLLRTHRPLARTLAAGIQHDGYRVQAKLEIFEASLDDFAQDDVREQGIRLALDLEQMLAPHYAAHALVRLSKAMMSVDRQVAVSLLGRAERALESDPDRFMAGQAYARIAQTVPPGDLLAAVRLFSRAVRAVSEERENETSGLVAAGYVEELHKLDTAAAGEVARSAPSVVVRAHCLIRLLDMETRAASPSSLDALESETWSAISKVRHLSKHEAHGWFENAKVWFDIARTVEGEASSSEIATSANAYTVEHVVAEVMKCRRLPPDRSYALAEHLQASDRPTALARQARMHLESGNIEAAQAVIHGRVGRRNHMLLEAEIGSAMVEVDPVRANELLSGLGARINSTPVVELPAIARALAVADPSGAIRALSRAAAHGRGGAADLEVLLDIADAAVTVGDNSTADEFLARILHSHRSYADREWLGSAHAAVAREVVRRGYAVTWARPLDADDATEMALALAEVEGVADSDLDRALTLQGHLTGDEEGRGYAAVVLAASRQNDSRTLSLMATFMTWQGNSWYDVKSDTAARAALNLASLNPTHAAELLGLAVTHPYGEWSLCASALEELVVHHPDPEQVVSLVRDSLEGSNIGDSSERRSLFAAAIASRFPAQALEYRCSLSPWGRPRLLAALAAAHAAENGTELVKEALRTAETVDVPWRRHEALISIAARLAPSMASVARANLASLTDELQLPEHRDVAAPSFCDVAAVYVTLNDEQAAAESIVQACRAVEQLTGFDAGRGLDSILEFLLSAPLAVVRASLTALLHAAQRTDDVVLSRVDLLLQVVFRVDTGPLDIYSTELMLAEHTVDNAFMY